MSEDLLLALLLTAPLVAAAVATFVAADRVRGIIKTGVVLALALAILPVATSELGSDEWDAATELGFGLALAAIALFLWAIGAACGWAARRAVRKERAAHR